MEHSSETDVWQLCSRAEDQVDDRYFSSSQRTSVSVSNYAADIVRGAVGKTLTEKQPPEVQFKENALRHSCISYSLARNPEHGLQLVSQWAGNSESTIRKHYLHLLTKSDGEEWFEEAGNAITEGLYAED